MESKNYRVVLTIFAVFIWYINGARFYSTLGNLGLLIGALVLGISCLIGIILIKVTKPITAQEVLDGA